MSPIDSLGPAPAPRGSGHRGGGGGMTDFGSTWGAEVHGDGGRSPGPAAEGLTDVDFGSRMDGAGPPV